MDLKFSLLVPFPSAFPGKLSMLFIFSVNEVLKRCTKCLSKPLGPAGNCLIHLGYAKNNVGLWFRFSSKNHFDELTFWRPTLANPFILGHAGHSLAVTLVPVHVPSHPKHSLCSLVQHPPAVGKDRGPVADLLTAGMPFPRAGVCPPSWAQVAEELCCCAAPCPGEAAPAELRGLPFGQAEPQAFF